MIMFVSRYNISNRFLKATVAVAVMILATTTTTTIPTVSAAFAAKLAKGGAGVGRLILDKKVAEEGGVLCHYDMVLVERIQGKPKTQSGLFVPDEELPRLHLCRVLSMGPGQEEENGRIAPMPEINVGDIVVAKNPWGIGPKDEETSDGKKLSYMRSQDIAAVVTGGFAASSSDDENSEN